MVVRLLWSVFGSVLLLVGAVSGVSFAGEEIPERSAFAARCGRSGFGLGLLGVGELVGVGELKFEGRSACRGGGGVKGAGSFGIGALNGLGQRGFG